MLAYSDFIARKSQVGSMGGFEPTFLPDCLFPFQRASCGWSIRKGRAGNFQGCGLGKTLQQLVCAENAVRHTNKPGLLLAPLGVVGQTVREAHRFGIDAVRSSDGKIGSGARVVVTNYDRLHYFDPDDFGSCSADESGGIKDFDSERTQEVTEFMRTMAYRWLWSATPAPNDYTELGTSSEALGEMGYQDMLTKFFKKETGKDHLGWGRNWWRMRGHAEHDFWRWVCSWSRSIRKPSDMGSQYSDEGFILPGLDIEEHCIKALTPRAGLLFDIPAVTVQEQKEEARRTLPERCAKVAELVANTGKPAVCWCTLNPEGDLITKLIPGAVQISGKDSDERKEEVFTAFEAGQIRVLVTKGQIAGWGLNWQHCAHQTMFPSYSYEMYHQCIHRSLRYGQKNRVKLDLVVSEGQRGMMNSLQKKMVAADLMYDRLVANMHDHLQIEEANPYTKPVARPSWLLQTK